ncbi:MAG: GNAT family N-acetyltransferase [Anaerolineae bacterium]
MERRALDIERDYEALLNMQRLSWEINFPTLEFNDKAFRRSLHDAARREEVYVYEIDDEPVGWLWLDLRTPSHGGHVRHIQVKRARWGRGIGRTIMEDAISLCQEKGCPHITLNVTKSNTRAVSLYRHLGFEAVDDRGERMRMKLEL